MALKLILLGWKKEFPKIDPKTKKTTGSLLVTSNARIYLPDDVVSYFNIPVATDQSYTGPPRSVIKTFTRTYYKNVADTAGKTSTVREFERNVSTKGEVIKKVARLQLIDKKIGTTNKLRTTSVRFPNYFNLIMIAQAMGTMIKTKNPGFFVMDGSGGKHAIVPSSMTDVFPGYKSGAWVVTAPIASSNIDDTSAQEQDEVPPPNDPEKAGA